MEFADGSALTLHPSDSFSGVLDNLHTGRDGLSGEYTPAMNPRRANDQPEPPIPSSGFVFIGDSGLESGFDPMSPLLYFRRFRLQQVGVVQERSGHLGVGG